MTEVIQFRVYPESRRGHYFDVEIHPTVTSMRKAASVAGGAKANFDGALAVVRGFNAGHYTADGRKVWRKTLGTMFFHKARLGVEVIAHESTHAAFRWMEAQKFNAAEDAAERGDTNCSDSEERFCHALGNIARQIANECHDRGLYE